MAGEPGWLDIYLLKHPKMVNLVLRQSARILKVSREYVNNSIREIGYKTYVYKKKLAENKRKWISESNQSKRSIKEAPPKKKLKGFRMIFLAN